MSTVGRRLLSSLVYSGSVQSYLKLSLEPYLFRDAEVELYDFISNHIASYGSIPAQETLESKGMGDALVEAPEPPEYYMDEVEKRYLRSSLKSVVVEANELLVNGSEVDAYESIMKSMATIHRQRNRKNLFDLREAHDFILEEYVKQLSLSDELGLLFGWPRLDKMTGGAKAGDLISFVGRPASGKTFKLLYVAHQAWMRGRVPLFVSMEMNTLIIAQRLAAMHSKVNLSHLLKGGFTKPQYAKLKEGLQQAGSMEHPFWVVDGNLTATVDDIIMLCRQLRPSAVFVDGAYLLRHPNPKASKWDRIAENAEWLKQKVAQDIGVPVITSYQFNRESSKKKKKGEGDHAGLEDIYGSDAIAQLSSVVLGLFQPDDSIEAQKQRVVTVLKGRHGETGSFSVNWDFHNMDFSQILEKQDGVDETASDNQSPDAYADMEWL